jgi:hypothetical protein
MKLWKMELTTQSDTQWTFLKMWDQMKTLITYLHK